MSIRFSNADFSDTAYAATASPLSIGTGGFSIGLWAQFVSNPGVTADLFMLGDQLNPTEPREGRLIVLPTFVLSARYDAGGVVGTDYSLSTSTWYWIVFSRSGTTARYRIFNDSTSTTPLTDQTNGGDTDNYNALDYIMLGESGLNNGCADARVTNLKVQTGVAWTDAECRIEASLFGIQKSGGTDRLCWKLKNINADTDGLYEASGSGPNMTNSGATTDASMPTNLSEPSGGASGGLFVKSPKLYSFGTMRRSL